jgi:cytochrome P450/NADPH-cytochrome P450 reductase
VLFFGCDHPDWDDLYADEYAEYIDSGYLEIHHAYSRVPDPAGVRFVQHRLWAERDMVLALIDGGARVYLCGDAVRLAPEVEATLIAIKDNEPGRTGTGHAWLAGLREAGRYAADVF